jgi:hypothetical protein
MGLVVVSGLFSLSLLSSQGYAGNNPLANPQHSPPFSSPYHMGGMMGGGLVGSYGYGHMMNSYYGTDYMWNMMNGAYGNFTSWCSHALSHFFGSK